MFVTLEGPEGAGKSTLARSLAARLEAGGHEVVVTREPGAGPFGGGVRRLLLEGEAMTPWAEVFLFLADRADHVATLVRPALERGAWVVCDRHADSTVVYQGHARGLDIAELRRLNRLATGGLVPDRTLLLDLPAEVGLARVRDANRLDGESIDFHRRVREGFLAEAALEPTRWVVIDASQPATAVLDEAWASLRLSNAAGTSGPDLG
ncbi:MAG: dTMP kinase [Fimbriimonadaceae bacterium]|nr:dTMP kinase [Fimbriimonadaceae bacterium]